MTNTWSHVQKASSGEHLTRRAIDGGGIEVKNKKAVPDRSTLHVTHAGIDERRGAPIEKTLLSVDLDFHGSGDRKHKLSEIVPRRTARTRVAAKSNQHLSCTASSRDPRVKTLGGVQGQGP